MAGAFGGWRGRLAGGEVKSKHTFRIGFTLLLEAMVMIFVSSSRRNIQEPTSNRPEGRLEGGPMSSGEGGRRGSLVAACLAFNCSQGCKSFVFERCCNQQPGIAAKCGCRQCWRRKVEWGSWGRAGRLGGQSWGTRAADVGQRLVGGWWVVPGGQDGRKGEAVCMRQKEDTDIKN